MFSTCRNFRRIVLVREALKRDLLKCHVHVSCRRKVGRSLLAPAESAVWVRLMSSGTPAATKVELIQEWKKTIHSQILPGVPDEDAAKFEALPEELEDYENAVVPDLLPDLPEPPVPPPIQELVGEASFESVGLGGWGPVGLIQNAMEWLHITCDLPWWGAIATGTVVVRLLMFPLVIASQRNTARMNNNLPQMQIIQLKMSDARERGDRIDAARYGQELMTFMNSKGLNPIKNFLVPLAQAPFFVCFFMALRGMANLPVDSMRQGGLFWFYDLTVPDEFYLLPLITSATLALTIEVGTDSARLASANMGMMKYFMRAIPVFIFPFTLSFPSGILVYWASTNFISLIQVSILKIPTVREYFKIEKLITHDKSNLPIKDKGFVAGAKESWTNMKISQELEDRQRIDKRNFLRAGSGAVTKTYKYDPTQPRNTIQAKKHEP